jgi:type III secretion protein C
VHARGESYEAQDESLHTVFTALSVPLGTSIVVSRAVARKRLSAVLISMRRNRPWRRWCSSKG